MRQGFLKFYLLRLLGESPRGMSGYALMKQIEEETGFWRPSPGSIYPLLAALEDAGLIHHRAEGDKKIYSLTAEGEKALAKAQQAKAQAQEGIRRSLRVLAGIFGEDAAQELADPWGVQRFKAIPPKLRQRVLQLKGLIRELLGQELREEEIKRVGEVLDKAIRRLSEYVQSH